jgi:transposase
VASAATAGHLLPEAGPAGDPARRGGDRALEEAPLAGSRKDAALRGQTIVFNDESGVTERPTVLRIWAPRGQMPVIQYGFNWQRLSAIAGLSFWRFYLRFFPDTIRAPQVVEFLKALRTQLRGRPLPIVWDGLGAHNDGVVRRWLEEQRGQVRVEFLPGYAPVLNPVEQIWNNLKSREVANLCAANLAEVGDLARHRLRSVQQRPNLIRAFWRQTELAF